MMKPNVKAQNAAARGKEKEKAKYIMKKYSSLLEGCRQLILDEEIIYC